MLRVAVLTFFVIISRHRMREIADASLSLIQVNSFSLFCLTWGNKASKRFWRLYKSALPIITDRFDGARHYGFFAKLKFFRG